MMVGKIAKIPFVDIEKIEIYYNSSKKTMQNIKKELGCDYIINAGFYELSKFVPVCGLVVNNKVLSPVTNIYGVSFNKNQIKFDKSNTNNFPFFVGGNPALIKDGKILNFQIPSGLQGDRGRSAIGITKDSLILRCVPDLSDTSDFTLSELAKDLLSYGCVDAINLDGGGSSQCDFNGDISKSVRIVNNFICVWTKEKESTDKKTYKVTASLLNVRQGPGTSYKIINSLLKNEIVEGTTIKNGWVYINKIDGWCSLTYLSQTTDSNVTAPEVPKSSTVEPNTQSTIDSNNSTTTKPSDPQLDNQISNPTNSENEEYKVNTAALNIRENPTVNSKSKGLLIKDSIVSVSKIQNGWGYIPSKSGWCSMSYLIKVDKLSSNTSASIEKDQKYKVTALALNVRESPTTNSKSKGLLIKNTVVSVSKTQNGWGYILDKNGWCSLSYLKKV